jgi:hypothetical protein
LFSISFPAPFVFFDGLIIASVFRLAWSVMFSCQAIVVMLSFFLRVLEFSPLVLVVWSSNLSLIFYWPLGS